MTTCDLCFDGRHIRCHDIECACTVCRKGAASPYQRTAIVAKPRQATVDRVRSSGRSGMGYIGMKESNDTYRLQVVQLLEHIAKSMGV